MKFGSFRLDEDPFARQKLKEPTMATPAATFSAAEAAVYDRQMRLWGVEAQQRLQRSHVLVSGLSALGSELVKNLVLSGMSVTLHDDRSVSPADAAAQFFLVDSDAGKNVRRCSVVGFADKSD